MGRGQNGGKDVHEDNQHKQCAKTLDNQAHALFLFSCKFPCYEEAVDGTSGDRPRTDPALEQTR